MSLTIHLGVADVRYPDRAGIQAERARRRPRGGVRWRRPRRVNSTTTGDVAEILESQYGLFSLFSVFDGKTITDTVEEAALGRLEDILSGQLPTGPFIRDADLQPIEEAFRKSIDNRSYDSRAPGVPTGAARKGIDHRLAHPYARGNPERPSFRDTGQLQNFFKAWITQS